MNSLERHCFREKQLIIALDCSIQTRIKDSTWYPGRNVSRKNGCPAKRKRAEVAVRIGIYYISVQVCTCTLY